MKDKENKRNLTATLFYGDTIRKMVLIYVFLVFIPSCIFMYIYYKKSVQNIQEEMAMSNLQALKQMEKYVSFKLEKIEETSDMIFINKKISAYLSTVGVNNTKVNQIDEYNEMLNIIDPLQINKDIFRIRLFCDADKMYASQKVNFFDINSLKSKEYYEDIINANGKIIWSDTYVQDFIDTTDHTIISCARVLKSPTNVNQVVGIAIIDIEESYLYNFINETLSYDEDEIFIINEDGIVISHKNKDKINQNIEDELPIHIMDDSLEGFYEIDEGKDKYYVIYKNIERTNWKIIIKTPMSSITNNANALGNASTYIFLLSSFTVIVLIFFIVFGLVIYNVKNHIKTLINFMETKGLENLETGFGYSNSIFGKLTQNIQSMIRTVRQLTKESYQAKMKEREAQLRALQAQINPHFLYNTLDTINWMAIRRNADDISFMLKALAKYFRLSLSKGEDIVTIEDEINLAQVYLNIQEVRFGEEFTYEINIDDNLESQKIPKLILQPIIENALLHGVQKKKDLPGNIVISVRQLNDQLTITIEDNGVGMNDEKIAEILAFNSSKKSVKSYGLLNVNERLKLFYGQEYGLEIFSVVGQGTKVMIKGKIV